MNFRRRRLTHLEYLRVNIYRLQALLFFLTMDDPDVEIEEIRVIDNKYYEVVLSMPGETNPTSFVSRWKEWESEELFLEYAILN